jgi:hypothetical protein
MKLESTADALAYLYTLSLNNSAFRFRGQANFDWTLKPSIYRVNDFLRYQTVNYESHILSAKPSEPQPPLTHTVFDLEWLMLCQHYGIPTRLLDWSTDILIALFFACENEARHDTDGVVFICNQNEYPMFAASAYDKHAMETQDLAFVSTNVINPRMRMQSGCFMIWGHAPLGEDSTETYDLWEYHQAKGESNSLTKIRIPKEAKKIILEELNHIYSITSDTIYLQNGYLETTYASRFQTLKENARLMTLYVTDADRLTPAEEQKARSMFKIDCRNMFGNTLRLQKIM